MADSDSVANDQPARGRNKRRTQIASTNSTASQAKRRKGAMSRKPREGGDGNSVKKRGELRAKRDGEGSRKAVKRRQSANRGQSQSCHQCRQSILSQKGMQEAKEGKRRAKCSTCTRFWCGSCLLNRYGVSLEDAEECKWSCPFCLNTCNCSLCRKKAGMLATGILTPLAKTSGFGSVSDYLTKSTDEIAACLQWAAQERAGSNSPDVGGEKQKQRRVAKSVAKKRRAPLRPSSAPARVQRVTKTAKRVQSPPSFPAEPGRRRSLRLQTIPESSPIPVRGGSSRWSMRPAKPAAFLCTSPTTRRYDSVGNSSDDSEQSDVVDMDRQTTRLQEKMADSPSGVTRLSSNSSVGDSPSSSSSEGSDSDEGEDGWMSRQLELSSLKLKWKSRRKEQKEEDLRKAKDERLRMRADRKREREEQRERVKNERHQVRVQERLLKQEELRRLLDEKKQQRVAERLTKEDELKKLKEKKREEKKRLQTALSVSLTDSKAASSPRTEKEGERQTERTLPLLPAFATPIQGNAEQLLQVLVFVNCFKDALGISGFHDIGAACRMLQTGVGLIELYTSLLRMVLPAEHHYRSILQEDLAPISVGVCHKMVTECVTDAVRDEEAPPLLLDFVPPKTPSARLHVLDFLIHEALASEEVVRCISSTVDSVRKMRGDQKQWEQQRVKEISHQLMKMNDDKCSLEDLTQMREKCLEEVKEQKGEAALSLWLARTSLRVTPLGKDRHGRLYWHLPHVIGVVVEDGSMEVSQWYHVNALDTFQELLASLDVMDDCELELLENLAQMQGHITSSFVS